MSWLDLDLIDRKILRRLLDYFTYKETAHELNIPIGTLGRRVQMLKKRFGCGALGELLRKAREAMNG